MVRPAATAQDAQQRLGGVEQPEPPSVVEALGGLDQRPAARDVDERELRGLDDEIAVVSGAAARAERRDAARS